MPQQYDLIVIGSGTGGYVAAIRAAQLGLKTAVVERQPALGGTCLNWGCIPTKALLEHAHALKIAQDWKDWGLTIGQAAVQIDMTQVQARKDRIVKGLTGGIELLFKKNKIEWVRGSGRLTGKGGVEVSQVGQKPDAANGLVAKEIIVATGSAPRSVPGVEIDRKRIITSDEAIGLKEIPKSIVVLGSGAVGVEFASIFRRFGSDVTIIELLPRLVPLEDESISAELEKSFRKQGIKVLTGTKVTKAQASGDSVQIDATLDGKTETIKTNYLLVATGRGPVTDGLGAEEIKLPLEKGYVRVDELFRTSLPGMSAIGDVITFGRPGHPQLAHVSSAEGIVTAERLAGRETRPINYDQVPSCTYCDPEIGSVGLTEAEARERGYEVQIGTFPFGVLARARIANEREGFVKIVADKKYDEILGVHMIGPRTTELVAEATLMLRLECTVEELVRTIHAHPTMSEAIGEAAHATPGAPIHW
ncbi:MAG TPA: dihydrolipoyl dehydrogenase [Vicinamibacterales bacterium]|nr:dihydrolipoyl dehydrogenase [Vicinamibacterales bacterium]